MPFSSEQKFANISSTIWIAGSLHNSGVCNVGLIVFDFCTLVSILWTVLHWTVHVGTSTHKKGVVSEL